MTNRFAVALMALAMLSVIVVYSASGKGAFWVSRRAPDFASITDIPERKARFFEFVRESLSSVNDEVEREREFVLDMRTQVESGKALKTRQIKRLNRIREAYALSDFEPEEGAGWARLLARVDIIPESLALAQAANESAWGTSRFAREGKNYFGQWCYEAGCGMVPARRNEGMAHEVRSFDSVRDSVAAYVRNLNTQAAFTEFRSLRAELRSRGVALRGSVLAGGLTQYSSRGEAYVRDLRQMIRVNHLETQVAARPLSGG